MNDSAQAALSSPEVAPVPATAAVPNDSGAPELQMRRRAAAVLEVLGGAKSPAEAAEGLRIALPSYYQLEARALEGLVSACEPRPRGRAAGEGKTFHALKLENDRLRQDLTRTQALTRAVQRAAGMQGKEDAPSSDAPVRRRRRATARALRAARELVPQASDIPGPSLPTSPLDVESPP
jgi:hypothetical protein